MKSQILNILLTKTINQKTKSLNVYVKNITLAKIVVSVLKALLWIRNSVNVVRSVNAKLTEVKRTVRATVFANSKVTSRTVFVTLDLSTMVS